MNHFELTVSDLYYSALDVLTFFVRNPLFDVFENVEYEIFVAMHCRISERTR